MSGRKNIFVIFGLVLSVSLMDSAFAAILVSHHYSRVPFDLLNVICGEVLEQEPEAKKIISAALKEYTVQNADGTEIPDVLSSLGYHFYDFSVPYHRLIILSAAAGSLIGILLFMFTFLYRNKIETQRIQALVDYLEQANIRKSCGSFRHRRRCFFKVRG